MTDRAGLELYVDSSDVERATAALRQMGIQAQTTEGKTGKLNKTTSDFGKTLSRVGRVLFSGWITQQIITKTIQQEQAVAQLNSSLKSTGRYTPAASQALQDYASQLQAITTYGDEAIIEVESLLLTFKQIGGSVFPKAVEATLDLSTKMGGDLKGAVVQLGKALNDPITGITALTRVGVTFDNQQKETIKRLVQTGQLAKAQAIILRELQTEFGGSAKAARDTFGGALTGLKNTLGDLIEGKGSSLTLAKDTINELNRTLNDPSLKAGFDNLTSAFLQLLPIVANVAAKIGDIFAFLKYTGQRASAVLSGVDYMTVDTPPGAAGTIDRSGTAPANKPDAVATVADSVQAIESETKAKLKQIEINGVLVSTMERWTDRQKAAHNLLRQAVSDWKDMEKAHEVIEALRDALPSVLDAIYPIEGAGRRLGITLEVLAQAAKDNKLTQEQLAEAAKIATKAFDEEVAQIRSTTDEMTEFAVQGARNLQTAFADFLFDPFTDGLDGMVRGFANALRRMAAEMASSAILKAIFGGLAGSDSAILSGIGKAFGGGKAEGGSVFPGTIYPVGERGPELFMPKSAGTIIPNNKLGGDINVQIDARGSDNPARILALAPILQAQIESAIQLKMRRGNFL
jgi:hypothetical protein